MPRKSMNELRAQALADFPDNTTGLITPTKLRTMFEDFIDAVAPAYAVMGRTGGSVTAGLTPIVVTMTSQLDSNPSETTTNAAAGTIARAERGTSYLNFDCDIEAPANRFVTFRLYKNGVATGGDVTVNGAGAGNPVSGSFSWTDYADPAATYDLRVTAEIAGVAVTLSNVSVLLQVMPVNSYV